MNFLLLHVMMVLTAGKEGKKRRKQARSTCFRVLPAATHEPIRHQWKRRVEKTRCHYSGGSEDFPAVSWILGVIL
jgi:hypothetical protein